MLYQDANAFNEILNMKRSVFTANFQNHTADVLNELMV